MCHEIINIQKIRCPMNLMKAVSACVWCDVFPVEVKSTCLPVCFLETARQAGDDIARPLIIAAMKVVHRLRMTGRRVVAMNC
jgi:hypothetical protein